MSSVGSDPFSMSLGPMLLDGDRIPSSPAPTTSTPPPPTPNPVPALSSLSPEPSDAFVATSDSDALIFRGTFHRGVLGDDSSVNAASLDASSSSGRSTVFGGLEIAAVTVSSVFLVLLAAALLVYRERRRKRHEMEMTMAPKQMEEGINDGDDDDDDNSMVSYNPQDVSFLKDDSVMLCVPGKRPMSRQSKDMPVLTVSRPAPLPLKSSFRQSPQGLVLFPSPPLVAAQLVTENSSSSSNVFLPPTPRFFNKLQQRVPSVILIPDSPHRSPKKILHQAATPIPEQLSVDTSMSETSSVADVRAALDLSFYSRPRTRSFSIGEAESETVRSSTLMKKRDRAATLPTVSPFSPPEFKCPDQAPPPLPSPKQIVPLSPAVTSRWSAVEMTEDEVSSVISDESSDVQFDFIPMPSPLGIRRPQFGFPLNDDFPNRSSMVWEDPEIKKKETHIPGLSPACHVKSVIFEDVLEMSLASSDALCCESSDVSRQL